MIYILFNMFFTIEMLEILFIYLFIYYFKYIIIIIIIIIIINIIIITFFLYFHSFFILCFEEGVNKLCKNSANEAVTRCLQSKQHK